MLCNLTQVQFDNASLFIVVLVCNDIRFVPGLCPECSEKLNYKSKKREVKRLKKSHKKAKKNNRKESSDKEENEEEFSPQTPEPEEPSTSTETAVATESNESLWRKGRLFISASPV